MKNILGIVIIIVLTVISFETTAQVPTAPGSDTAPQTPQNDDPKTPEKPEIPTKPERPDIEDLEIEIPSRPEPTEAPEAPTNEEESEAEFRTQTQGGWGSTPNGNNPGKYLHTNFAKAFPNGITIGQGKTLRFTSAQAITDFLPAGGKAEALTQSEINPKGLKNNLAAQLLALTISVGFDNKIASFSASSHSLATLKITEGTFKGKTVQFLLQEANKALGGNNTTYSLSSINDALSKCNQNYVDGKSSNGFLSINQPSSGSVPTTSYPDEIEENTDKNQGKNKDKVKGKGKDKNKETKGESKNKGKGKDKNNTKNKGKGKSKNK